MVVSGVLGAAGSVMQGNAQAAAYNAQAAAAEQNRGIAELQASESLQKGAREERRFRREANQFAASQESLLAASGAAMSGSALNVLADTAMGIEEDAAQVRYNTLKEKWGYDVQAVNFGNEASAARASAKSARTAGYIGAGTSILGAATNIWGSGALNATAANGLISVQAKPPIDPRYGDYWFKNKKDWWM
jgi:hypothetical protein